MKIIFEDNSFIEMSKQDGKIIISIQAKDYQNPLKKIINSVEINEEQFKELISEL
jgi:tRNA threonylcarbamoyladenosine modification (KEOPS) complex  Pcc1 subunit